MTTLPIDPARAANTAAATPPVILPPGAKTGFSALGQADFVRLLTTQLQGQSPLDPVDNKEMIAQLAQFSSLSGITQINTTLQQVAEQMDLQPIQASLQTIIARLDAALVARPAQSAPATQPGEPGA